MPVNNNTFFSIFQTELMKDIFGQFSKDAVKISMDTFIKRFQPENYMKWRSGNDVGPHPEDSHRSNSDT